MFGFCVLNMLTVKRCFTGSFSEFRGKFTIKQKLRFLHVEFNAKAK